MHSTAGQYVHAIDLGGNRRLWLVRPTGSTRRPRNHLDRICNVPIILDAHLLLLIVKFAYRILILILKFDGAVLDLRAHKGNEEQKACNFNFQ